MAIVSTLSYKKTTVREIALNYVECALEPVTAKDVAAGANWSRCKNSVIHITYLSHILRTLESEGWLRKLGQRSHNDPARYEYVGNPDLVVKPKEPVKVQLSTPIVPPRTHKFVPYVPEAQPAYRAGAFDFLKHASAGVF